MTIAFRFLLLKDILGMNLLVFLASSYTQGEIRRFRISEILRKFDSSSFRHISGGRLRRETRKSKMRSRFAFPQRFRSVSVG